jgi:hypothetical protein
MIMNDVMNASRSTFAPTHPSHLSNSSKSSPHMTAVHLRSGQSTCDALHYPGIGF